MRRVQRPRQAGGALFNRVPKRNRGVVFGTRFGGICDWYLRFDCPKHRTGAAQDRSDFVCLMFVCFSACLSHCFFGPFFEQVDGRTAQFSEKIAQKTGSHPARDAEMSPCRGRFDATFSIVSTRRRFHATPGPISMPPCRGRCTLLKWRLRRHPVGGLFGGDAVGNVHLSRHLPPRVPF